MTTDEILVCIDGIVPVRSAPDPQSARVTDLLFGEEFVATSEREGLVHGRTRADGVEGFVPAGSLAPRSGKATHRVRRTFIHVYPAPDLVATPSAILPMNARVEVTDRATPLRYPGGGPGSTVVQLSGGGWITDRGICPVDRFESDLRSVAAMFVGAVYLPGGKTWLGCDGPGLVQTVLAACGVNVPRHLAAQVKLFERRGIPDGGAGQGGSVVYSDSACGLVFGGQMIAARAETMLVESISMDEFSKCCVGSMRRFSLNGRLTS